MSAAEELACCADAVERACAELVNGAPAAVDRGAAVLESAAERMQRLLAGLTRSPEALAEAWRLRRSVRCAEVLLENAASYHRGWRGRVAVMVSGYSPDGSPGRISPAGRVWLEA